MQDQEYDVIIIGLSRWDSSLNSSVLNIAKEWSKTNRVFYIDRPFSIKDYYLKREKEAIQRKSAVIFGEDIYHTVKFQDGEFVAVTPRLSLPINFIPEGKLYDKILAFNKKLIGEVISRIIKDYNVKSYVFLNSFIPEYFDVFPNHILQPIYKLYRSSDDISQESYIARHGVRMELEALRIADICLATSYGLKEKLEKAGKVVHRIPNAVDFKMFDVQQKAPEKPKDFEGFEGKIILLTGNISQLRIDYELIAALCKDQIKNTILIIGPYSKNDIEKYGLNQYNNLKFIGLKRVSELKNYLAYSDCAIIPFLLNPLTNGIYPLKINEYLALGLPVVSTKFSKDIIDFDSIIYLANDKKHFLELVRSALLENSIEKRKARILVSQGNTWEKRVAEIKKLL